MPLMICTSFTTMKFFRSVFTSVWNNAVALVDHPSDAPPNCEYRRASGTAAGGAQLFIAWAPGENLPRSLVIGSTR